MGRHSAEAIGEQRALSPAEQIFERHGLGHLLDVAIINPHTSQPTTVSDALQCQPFAEMVGTLDENFSSEQFALGIGTYVEERRIIQTPGEV